MLGLDERHYLAIEDPNVRNWIAISMGLALLLGVTAQGQTTNDGYPNRPVPVSIRSFPTIL